MSLNSALNIGRNALAVHQAAIQVTTNNIANAGNPDYTRQTAQTSPNGDQQLRPGMFVGTGVNLTSVQRQIDNALLARLRAATADNAGAHTAQAWLTRVESVFNALGTNGLSSQMSEFFNSWSKLAGSPQDLGLRQIVLTNGTNLSRSIQDVRRQLNGLRTDLDQRLEAQASSADDLARRIADLNGRIAVAEGGLSGQANGLRDQRDALIRQLSELMDVTTTTDGRVVNVFVGSQPLVLGTQSRGVQVQQTTGAAGVETTLVFKDDPSVAIPVRGGELGGLLSARSTAMEITQRLDGMTRGLIFELNKIHSAGQGLVGLSRVSGQNPVKDANARLDSSLAGLPFPVSNGSFVVTITDNATGMSTSKLIRVELAPGTPVPTSLNDLAAQIADSQISATVAGGQLTIAAISPGHTISFSQDTSGVLAALGINTFFSGTDASNITVNPMLANNPSLLAAAANGSPGDNQAAKAIALLDTQPLSSAGGLTLRQVYDTMVSNIGASASAARTVAEGTELVLQTLQAQREALSGVSLDEESINLIKQQRAFQGAARVISTVDELLQTVLNLVR